VQWVSHKVGPPRRLQLAPDVDRRVRSANQVRPVWNLADNRAIEQPIQ
jgi:hypothetical protein